MTDGPKTIETMTTEEISQAIFENAAAMNELGAKARKYKLLLEDARTDLAEMLIREAKLEAEIRRRPEGA
jgi:hypothetical protein